MIPKPSHHRSPICRNPDIPAEDQCFCDRCWNYKRQVKELKSMLHGLGDKGRAVLRNSIQKHTRK